MGWFGTGRNWGLLCSPECPKCPEARRLNPSHFLVSIKLAIFEYSRLGHGMSIWRIRCPRVGGVGTLAAMRSIDSSRARSSSTFAPCLKAIAPMRKAVLSTFVTPGPLDCRLCAITWSKCSVSRVGVCTVARCCTNVHLSGRQYTQNRYA